MGAFLRRPILLVALAGAAVCAALALGYERGRAALRPDSAPLPWHARLGGALPGDPHALGLAAGVAARAGVDPLAPPGMPEGVRIDPTTGYLEGAQVNLAAGEQHVRWAELDPVDAAGSRSDAQPAPTAFVDQRVVLIGFAMPLYDPRDRREFVLLGSHYSCCFGRLPSPGGLVRVRLAQDAADQLPTLAPVVVRGTLRLDPLRLQGDRGPPLSLYRLEDAHSGPLLPP